MDFTQDDCQGTSHQLFTELDAGQVVILDFVMLNCAPCVVATNALQAIVAPYEFSHPGRVQIYTFGFLNAYTCEQMMAWGNNNDYSHPIFTQGEAQVSYYGGMGMPTIVVVGTDGHDVFYEGLGYAPKDDAAIIAAIDTALLYSPTGVPVNDPKTPVRIYPTLFTDQLTLSGTGIQGGTFRLADVLGNIILEARLTKSEEQFRVGTLTPGLYFGIFTADGRTFSTFKLIRK